MDCATFLTGEPINLTCKLIGQLMSYTKDIYDAHVWLEAIVVDLHTRTGQFVNSMTWTILWRSHRCSCYIQWLWLSSRVYCLFFSHGFSTNQNRIYWACVEAHEPRSWTGTPLRVRLHFFFISFTNLLSLWQFVHRQSIDSVQWLCESRRLTWAIQCLMIDQLLSISFFSWFMVNFVFISICFLHPLQQLWKDQTPLREAFHWFLGKFHYIERSKSYALAAPIPIIDDRWVWVCAFSFKSQNWPIFIRFSKLSSLRHQSVAFNSKMHRLHSAVWSIQRIVLCEILQVPDILSSLWCKAKVRTIN